MKNTVTHTVRFTMQEALEILARKWSKEKNVGWLKALLSADVTTDQIILEIEILDPPQKSCSLS